MAGSWREDRRKVAKLGLKEAEVDRVAWPASLSGRRALVSGLVLTLLASLFFWSWPQIDLLVVDLLHRDGDSFVLQGSSAAHLVRAAAYWLQVAILAAALLALLVSRHPAVSPLVRPPAAAFILVSFAVTIGVITMLKELWGRARPRHLEGFGGDDQFSSVWMLSNECAGNCSFASGEAAAAFWLVGVALLAPARWRARAIGSALAFALLVSLVRMAEGGHFLSDVVLAWCLTWLTIVSTHALLLHPRRIGPAAAG